MSVDILTYALARKYANSLVNGLGAIKGAPCTIASIKETPEGSVITFGWTGEDGTTQSQDLLIPHGLNETERTELMTDLQAYIDEQIELVEPDNIDDGEI